MATANTHSLIKGLSRTAKSRHKLLLMAREGVPKNVLVRLAKALKLSPKELAAILQISERTLQRFGTSGLLNAALSSRVVQLVEIHERGIEVFGDAETLRDWLRTKSIVLGEPPIELLDTPLGAQMVLDEIMRIAYGVYM